MRSCPTEQPPLSVAQTPVAHALVIDEEKPEASQVPPFNWHTVSQEEEEEVAFFQTIDGLGLGLGLEIERSLTHIPFV